MTQQYGTGPVAPAQDPGDAERSGLSSEVSAVARAVVEAVERGAGVGSAFDAVEAAARSLVRRVTDRALSDPRPVPDQRRLAKELGKRSSGPSLGGATAAAVGTKIARRLGPARIVARRSPLWLAVTAAPAVYSSINRGAEELHLVASHLVLRARAAGYEPDPDRVRRVAVQVVSGQSPAPDQEPSHGPLAFGWARRAVRAAMPFAKGVRTKDPEAMAAVAAGVDAAQLAAPAPAPR